MCICIWLLLFGVTMLVDVYWLLVLLVVAVYWLLLLLFMDVTGCSLITAWCVAVAVAVYGCYWLYMAALLAVISCWLSMFRVARDQCWVVLCWLQAHLLFCVK